MASISPSFILFVLIAVFTVAGGAGVAFSRNIVYSAFSLLAAFAGMVGLFAFLSADFLAVIQLLVYVGGILVLILFAVMLTSRISATKNSNPSANLFMGASLVVMLLAVLTGAIFGHRWAVHAPGAYEPTSALIGDALLGPYLLPFEVAGVMLLAAMLAAVVVARKELKDEPAAASPQPGEAPAPQADGGAA